MKKRFLKAYVTKTADNKYRAIASTDVVDRYGDIVDQAGIDVSNYMKNPVMLWAHNGSADGASLIPVAKCLAWDTSQPGKSIVDFEFNSPQGSPLAPFIQNSYENGFLNALSIGFLANEREGNTITSSEILEVSFVPVPANQEALRLAFSKGFDFGGIKKDLEKAADLLNKGEVEDAVDAEEAAEQKWQKWCEMTDILSAMWTVYFDPDTEVEAFAELLGEVIALLQEVQANDGEDDDADEKSAALKAKIVKMLGGRKMLIRAGKVLSSKNQAHVEKAMTHMTDMSESLENAVGALEKVLEASSSTSNGGADDSEDDGDDDEKGLALNDKDLRDIRSALNIATHQTSFATSLVKDAIAKVGQKQ